MSELLSSITGGGGLPKLAPDLTFPSTLSASTGITIIPSIDASGSLTTVLSLTGKFSLNYLSLSGFTAENGTIKMTVDGVVVWDDTYTLPPAIYLIGAKSSAVGLASKYQCEQSLLLEVQTLTDTSIQLEYNVNPIL